MSRTYLGEIIQLGARFFLLCAAISAVPILALENLTPQAEALIADAKARVAQLQAQAQTPAAQQAGTLADQLARPDPAQSDIAIAPAERRVAQSPESMQSLSDYALWLLRQRKLDEAAAIAYYAHTKTLTPRGQSGALTIMAEARIGQGRLKDGVDVYKYALELDPENARIQNRLRALQERFDIRISQLNVDAERDAPTVCAVFTAPLQRPLPIRAADYVKISPAADVDVYAAGDRLCIKGLLHGRRYSVTYRAGIPASPAAKMPKDDVREVVIGNRTERASFAAGRIILPRTGKNLLPIKTVNLSRVNLRVFAVGERALVRVMQQENWAGNLSRYNADNIADTHGREIWQGFVAPANSLNRDVTTLLSMDKMVGGRPTGIYVISASTNKEKESDEGYIDLATQWVIVSDIGLTALKGSDGLTLFARSLDKASSLAGVTITLIARNNEILASAVTNAQGKARFAPGLLRGLGGMQISHIIAKAADGDLNVLRLDGAALDLSERGIEGADSVRTVLDAFLYTERGIYRPGETVRVSALLRTNRMAAQSATPLVFSIIRPDGTELYKQRSIGDALGSYDVPVKIPAGARSGTWEVRSYLDPKLASLGTVKFRVEDFVPQRIELIAKPLTPIISRGEVFAANLSGKFYYGPPASGLPVDISGDVVADETPFPAYKTFSFGRTEESFDAVSVATLRDVTDDAGNLAVKVDLGDIPDTTKPLKARLGLTLFDVSGRPVYTQVTARVKNANALLGIKAKFAGYVGENQPAPFEIVALNNDGKPLAGRVLDVAWVREDYDYSWYSEGGNWYSRTSVTDMNIANMRVTTSAKGLATLARGFPGGRYRLEVRDANSEAVSSYRFDAGWWSSGETSNAPDALELSLKSSDVTAGGTLSAFVKAPFDGEALVAVLGNDVMYTTTVRVSKAGSTITVPVDGNWGAGAYLMVSAYRPKAGAVSPLPVRAMGLAWFGIDRARRTLPVSFTVPAETLPRQKITLPVSIKGGSGTIGMTIAAVDEGVLALTRFASPKPDAHYLGQRQLGLDVFDHYGLLIQPANGLVGNLQTGGDASLENAQGTQTRSSKVIALFTRQVSLDGNGQGSVTLDLPDFNGRLRLMAVAWSQSAVGSGEANLSVRDPVVADLVLPRFIAPGDKAQATLSLHNVSGKPQSLRVSLSGNNGLGLSGALAGLIPLKNGERRDIPVTLVSGTTGDAKAILTVDVGGRKITREWDLAVRPASTFTTERQTQLVAPGKSLTLTKDMLAGFAAGSTKASLTVSNRPEFDVAALIDELNTYPYGCTEQTVSAALPLLYLADVATLWSKTVAETEIRQRVDSAILKIVERQNETGGIGYWNASDKADGWTSAYAFEFLSRARAQKYYVPPVAFDNLRRYLTNYSALADDIKTGVYPESRAYALYAIARVGLSSASDVRYFAENSGSLLRTKLAKAQLAGALAAVGETKRANVEFAAAARIVRPSIFWWDYGTLDRDSAAALVILSEASNDPKKLLAVADALERSVAKRGNGYFSTQESAWLLMAAHRIATAPGATLEANIGGLNYGPTTRAYRAVLDAKMLVPGTIITNRSPSAPLRVMTSVRGASLKPQPAVNDGFTISRHIYGMSGAKLDAVPLRQNGRVVVVIEGVKVDGAIGETLITDLLPAGLEIEAILGGDAASGSDDSASSKISWLGSLTPLRFSDARDDRFVASPNLDYLGGQKFRVAYIARAITPGNYIHPGVYIEDMYQPRFKARGNTGRLLVVK
jgi:alpha-2-macroglobulin